MRSHGLAWNALIAIVLIIFVAESAAWRAVYTAPAFWKVWFLGSAILAVLGALTSLVWFRESISLLGWLGIAMAVGGSVILIFK